MTGLLGASATLKPDVKASFLIHGSERYNVGYFGAEASCLIQDSERYHADLLLADTKLHSSFTIQKGLSPGWNQGRNCDPFVWPNISIKAHTIIFHGC
ncbi:hypothetical protein Agabi119p4_9652 [Agaricus bisporus var. burnettii]|uniref:Uncharacterized protein n=1 Tax=Agaricus bisporus var. burnettii TaxID=192524 RepID=A0A8H7C419_AGABI|nr:hypothetical protein Agabi119p4_9652 [Agaricus bisporus var. burnettii]